MNLRLDRTVPFPRDSVFTWWTDFREDDHLRPGSPAASSRAVLRRSGNEIWLRDRAIRQAPIAIEEHVILDPPYGYAVEGRYPGADVRYAYRFDDEGRGTHVTLDVELRPRHVGRILVPLTAWWWRRYAERDFDYHLEEMRRDLDR